MATNGHGQSVMAHGWWSHDWFESLVVLSRAQHHKKKRITVNSQQLSDLPYSSLCMADMIANPTIRSAPKSVIFTSNSNMGLGGALGQTYGRMFEVWGDSLNWKYKSLKVSKCLGVLVSWSFGFFVSSFLRFFVSSCLRFKVSEFQSSKVSRFQSVKVSKFRRFKNHLM